MGKNTDKDIPCGNCCPTSFLKGNFPDSVFLSPVTSVEVDSYISQMDDNKSIGDPLVLIVFQSHCLKIRKTHISPLISSLINDSFLCGIFPSKLKLAKVTPVFKKGSRQDKDNYRPISVLFFVKFLKRPCLSAFMAILNLVTFFIHSSLALGERARQIMD